MVRLLVCMVGLANLPLSCAKGGTGGSSSSTSGDLFGMVGHVERGRTHIALGIQLYSQMIIRLSSHLLSIVFRFHYDSQEGDWIPRDPYIGIKVELRLECYFE